MSAGAKRRREQARFGRPPGSQCLAKDRYHSAEAAERAISQLRGFARAYRCKICPYLHLTSKPRR